VTSRIAALPFAAIKLDTLAAFCAKMLAIKQGLDEGRNVLLPERSDLDPGRAAKQQLPGDRKRLPMHSSPLQLIGFNISSATRLLKRGSLLLVFALASFIVSRTIEAVSPPPDGDYGNGNTAEGANALFNLTNGFNNTAIGSTALFSNDSGAFNTATGSGTLNSNTSGGSNTATGAFALFRNVFGRDNTATGVNALLNNRANNNTATGSNTLEINVTGVENTATGFQALNDNQTGSNNTATGSQALFDNNADYNTATGFQALFGNSTGSQNTANGALALINNGTGSDNTASGFEALLSNTSGNNNTAAGFQALFNNSTAAGNTANGFRALFNNTTGLDNTADGRQALQNNTSGSFNVALGNLAGHNLTTGGNNIDIGNQGVPAEAKTIRIGEQGNQNRTFIAGIFGSTAPAGVQVFVNSNGRLGTATSSARFKDDIKPMNKASEAILALKPVTFRYKHELDPDGIPQFGLVAEQVEKVNPDLVARDADGKVNTVRYEAVNAMLLNEFLKAHRKLDQQQAMIDRQQKQIEALTATVQKVSDQIALSKPLPQLVPNP
jgi:hypothetical protein